MRGEQGELVVLACSALKEKYRAAIAASMPHVQWIFLDGSFDVIASRMRERPNHYMPESLLRSQFDAMERPDDATTISIELSPGEQVEAALYVLQKHQETQAT